MIDFRYHLVSIISIFLALAVGIVLGAGPLQANLGSQLTDQVSALRAEKQELNDQLAASEQRVAAADEYAEAVSGRVIEDALIGHTVAVIVLPSADGTLVDLVEEAVETSGATLSATVTIDDDWFDPSLAPERAEAATAAASTLGLSSSLSGDALLAQVLARLTVSTDLVSESESRAAALTTLTDAGMVGSSTEELEPADLAVIISGDFAGDEVEVQRRAETIRTIARLVADGSAGAVVAGPQPVISAGQPVSSDAVAAIRSVDASARLISTVDHASDAPGPAIVVLALESELVGQVGHYGTAEGATAAAPRVAP
ncbi:copper transporter [Intrasporangium sp.]|uniref:copper transporter n=1 Tax=Intrasporangium sp. TaxID=1925024 RepID=UPI002939F9A8|nr:copper transporter [Intrasporangium sp.]MDV3221970.1 copper transporter [Intrasporangium sp.]